MPAGGTSHMRGERICLQGDQSREGRENMPAGGTSHVRGERIYLRVPERQGEEHADVSELNAEVGLERGQVADERGNGGGLHHNHLQGARRG
eukprot:1106578-Prorocentrum_minimum.AAC.1